MTMPAETPRSCAECPSCLSSVTINGAYQSNFGTGTEMCAPFGYILSVPGRTAVNVEIKRGFADKCEYYGDDRTPLEFPEASVAVPRSMSPDDTDEYLASCGSCKNFIPADVVQNELGWNAPMCGAFGRLLLTSRLLQEPQRCGRAEQGPNQGTTMMVKVLPMYDPDAVADAERIRISTSIVSEAFIEPLEYPTDRPVEKVDAADGIIAWRKILHPKYGERKPPLWLPIFDPETFTEDQRARIPQTGCDEHPELYLDYGNLVHLALVAMLGLDKAPVLTGESGIGKTELFRHLAWLCQMPFNRLSLNKSTEVDDLIGKWMGEAGSTVWLDGELTKSWREPEVVVLDEWNTPPDAVMQSLRPLTDNSKQLVLLQGRGNRIPRNVYNLFGMTQNPTWDLKYTGTNQLSNADEERCAWVQVDFPSEEIERAILVRWCKVNGYEIEAKTLDAIMEIAKDIRRLTDPKAPTLSFSWGIRPQIAVAQGTQYLSLMESYKMNLLSRIDPTQADTVRNFVTGFDS